MGALLWLIMRLEPISGPHGLAQLLALVPVIAGGLALYALLLRLFGVLDWREALVRSGKSVPPDLHPHVSHGKRPRTGTRSGLNHGNG